MLLNDARLAVSMTFGVRSVACVSVWLLLPQLILVARPFNRLVGLGCTVQVRAQKCGIWGIELSRNYTICAWGYRSQIPHGR